MSASNGFSPICDVTCSVVQVVVIYFRLDAFMSASSQFRLVQARLGGARLLYRIQVRCVRVSLKWTQPHMRCHLKCSLGWFRLGQVGPGCCIGFRVQGLGCCIEAFMPASSVVWETVCAHTVFHVGLKRVQPHSTKKKLCDAAQIVYTQIDTQTYVVTQTLIHGHTHERSAYGIKKKTSPSLPLFVIYICIYTLYIHCTYAYYVCVCIYMNMCA